MEDNVTIIIKTFERPNCLMRLVKSIRKYYKKIAILVVDDSKSPISPLPEEITGYYHLPFDSGLSYGRNFALEKIETKYFLLCDDDMIFTEDTDLEKIYSVLEKGVFDIVSCHMVDHIRNTNFRLGINRWGGNMEIKNGKYIHTYGKPRFYKDDLPVYDIVLNFFMASKEKIGLKAWDENIKIGYEHSDFFLQAKSKSLLSTVIPGVFIYHYPEDSKKYYGFRTRITGEFHELWKQKYGIKEEFYIGQRFQWKDKVRYFYNHILYFIIRLFKPL
ncbi:MAG: glycosyltransferase family 2 protein [Chlorogloea purpurea SAG 13.99]|jgi:glycosyltransferase involved in cell wall biosynthesis|nr:glycosyltransferase family 2 protein [Chlorogloea purpurea SAG 13.99]